MPPSPSPPPPTKASLKQWWKHWTLVQKMKAREQPSIPGKVFGVPLRDSLKTASVQISTANQDGELYVWGYIPVVVAKCGLFLKENGTEVEGVFRVSGSTKRMRELQDIFETPPKYGKNIEWKDHYFTPHDVASLFRRFLTQMPEPIIPHAMYHEFRSTYSKKPLVTEEAIQTYKRLISSMPRANQYLLLYVLDLLTVFARKFEKNRMTATNLAVIFRPAVLNHPSHEMSPEHHRLSQEVLEFLIEHQDWFMLDIPPPPRQDSVLVPGGSPIVDDLYVNPGSSDEDDPSSKGNSIGGWKLGGFLSGGGTKGQVRIGRRRTYSERSSPRYQLPSGSATRLTGEIHSTAVNNPSTTATGGQGLATVQEHGSISKAVKDPAVPFASTGVLDSTIKPLEEKEKTGGSGGGLTSLFAPAHNQAVNNVHILDDGVKEKERGRTRHSLRDVVFGSKVSRARTLPTNKGNTFNLAPDTVEHRVLRKKPSIGGTRKRRLSASIAETPVVEKVEPIPGGKGVTRHTSLKR